MTLGPAAVRPRAYDSGPLPGDSPSSWTRSALLSLVPFLFQEARPPQEPIPTPVIVGLPDPSLGRGLVTLDAEGRLDGFGRRLVELAARNAGLEVEFRRIPTGTGEHELLAGQVDVLCPLSVNHDRVSLFNFTTPILMVDGGVFVRPGTTAPTSLRELAQRRIVVAGAGVAHQFCVESGLECTPMPTLQAALQSVIDGNADCAVTTQVAGRVELERLGMAPLDDARLEHDRLRQAFALALRPSCENLEARLNYGLALARDSGRWDELYDTWVAHYQPKPRRPSLLPVVLVLVALVGAGLVGVFVLRRRLARSVRALDASEMRYRVVADSLPALVTSVFVGEDGRRERRFATSNLDAWRRRFPGLDPGKDDEALLADVHPEDRDRYAESWLRSQQRGERFDLEFRLRAAGGRYHWLHATATPVPASGGVLWQGLLLDTSQLREAQDERHRLELELAEARKLEGLGLMAGSIAHDFNNYLMEIRGNIELALEGSEERQRLERLRAAIAGSERAAERTQHLLASAGETRIVPQAVDLGSVVRSVVDRHARRHPDQARPVLELDGTGPWVQGDAELLVQALEHLLENATESIPAGRRGSIHVRVGTSVPAGRGRDPGETSWAEVLVRDDGEGMDDTTLQRVFDPFFSTKFVGRGLGLTIVQRTVERHGGTIQIRSRPGTGTSARLRLPLAAPPASLAAPPTPSAPEKRVLVVDDETSVLAVTCSLLESRGWSTGRASDLEAALARLREGMVTVVLMDRSMPGTDGLAPLERLRREFPGLPVVLMSGSLEGEAHDPVQADGFLSKPFSSAQLIDALEQALTASSQRS